MHSCSVETHNKCENSALCHLCDGVRLYKNSNEERQRKLQEREERKRQEKTAAFRTHKKEKKEGMGLEKDVSARWNAGYQKPQTEELFKVSNKQVKVQKPRFEVEEPVKEVEVVPEVAVPSKPLITLSSLGSPIRTNKKPMEDAKRQTNSGAMWYAKGDIKTMDYLMECKERGTVNARGEKTISIPKEWLTKQALEAFQENRHFWLLPFRYKNDDEIYVIKTLDQEIEMYQEMRRLREELEALKSESK